MRMSFCGRRGEGLLLTDVSTRAILDSVKKRKERKRSERKGNVERGERE